MASICFSLYAQPGNKSSVGGVAAIQLKFLLFGVGGAVVMGLTPFAFFSFRMRAMSLRRSQRTIQACRSREAVASEILRA